MTRSLFQTLSLATLTLSIACGTDDRSGYGTVEEHQFGMLELDGNGALVGELDFADDNGRAVIITGLPYPAFKDPRVCLECDSNIKVVWTSMCLVCSLKHAMKEIAVAFLFAARVCVTTCV